MALPKNFEPEQGSTGRYTLRGIKPDERTKIRVLSEFIAGRSIWLRNENDESKRVPFRLANGQSAPVGIMNRVATNKFNGKPESWKQFIAAVVWNYNTKQVEILETDKAPIIEQIFDHESDEDWGDSREYDLSLKKTGQGSDTRWSVVPSNKAPFKCPEDWKTVDLQALLRGENPFEAGEKEEAPAPSTDFDPADIAEDGDVPF